MAGTPVFNLTEKPITYRKRVIPPNGGSFTFLDLRKIPARDQALAKGTNAVLAFGSLPAWWLAKQASKKAAIRTAQAAAKAKAEAKAGPPAPAMAVKASPPPVSVPTKTPADSPK